LPTAVALLLAAGSAPTAALACACGVFDIDNLVAQELIKTNILYNF